MKNIFELAQEEKETRGNRIHQALASGCPRGASKFERCFIAEHLYEVKWSGNTYHESAEMTHEAILENFCWNIFGCSLEEVLIAWDRYLG